MTIYSKHIKIFTCFLNVHPKSRSFLLISIPVVLTRFWKWNFFNIRCFKLDFWYTIAQVFKLMNVNLCRMTAESKLSPLSKSDQYFTSFSGINWRVRREYESFVDEILCNEVCWVYFWCCYLWLVNCFCDFFGWLNENLALISDD